MKNLNIYPAVFTPCDEGGYIIHFPDLAGTHSQGSNLEDALNMARDALAVWLDSLSDDLIPYPSASDPADIALDAGQFISLIDVNMVAYRRHKETKAVKKTLTIPSWLNVEAEKANAPFSDILQRGLKEFLGISNS